MKYYITIILCSIQ